MAQLRAGLKDVAKEIEFHRTQSPLANDKFVPVMREFQAAATCRLAEVEDQYQDMKVILVSCFLFDYLYLTSNIFRPGLNAPYVYSAKTLQQPSPTSSLEYSIPS